MRKHLWKKVSGLILTAGLIIATAAGCGGNSGEETEGGSETTAAPANQEAAATDSEDAGGELKKLRIGYIGSGDEPIYYNTVYAVKNGYFDEELKKVGYEPEYVAFTGGGPEMNEALAAGELDVGVVGDLPIFTAKSNGIDTKIIAMADSKMQYSVLVANDEIKEPKDLEGKRVIITTGTVNDFFWREYAKANDIDTSKVELINAASDINSLLQAGEADACASPKYILAMFEGLGLGHMLEGQDYSSDIYTTSAVEIAQRVLDENDETGVAINKALIRSYKDIAADPEAFYDAMATQNFPKEVWKTEFSFDETLSFLSPEITDEARAHLEELNDWAVENSIISQPVELDSFIDTSYYERAASELGE